MSKLIDSHTNRRYLNERPIQLSQQREKRGAGYPLAPPSVICNIDYYCAGARDHGCRKRNIHSEVGNRRNGRRRVLWTFCTGGGCVRKYLSRRQLQSSNREVRLEWKFS